jgi:anaerobic selenocysteine-containing dehydrogenase
VPAARSLPIRRPTGPPASLEPNAAERAGIREGDGVVVESPRGAISGTAILWPGLREDTIFFPNTFGPMQAMADELGTPR